MTEGIVFDIQRFSIQDGPGIRTTVFLKGCPLQCHWCHNPESWRVSPELMFHPERCVGCGTCLDVCKVEGALNRDPRHRINRDRCTGCGDCVRHCTGNGLEKCGQSMSVEQVMAEVERDRSFYEHSGGGMTVSGGEPLLQPDFCASLLAAASASGIHTALDTCGYAPFDVMRTVAQAADLVLFDVKIVDARLHSLATGVENGIILENLNVLNDSHVPVIVRVPVIPGYTDSSANLRAIGQLAAAFPNVQQVDLMRYNSLGETKWQRLDRSYGLAGTQPQSDTEMRRLKALVEGEGVSVTIQG
jgi:pyruvate formate lyase activating enzyme